MEKESVSKTGVVVVRSISLTVLSSLRSFRREFLNWTSTTGFDQIVVLTLAELPVVVDLTLAVVDWRFSAADLRLSEYPVVRRVFHVQVLF